MYIPKILIIVTGTDTYRDGNLATGLWLSEFTHIFHRAKEQEFEITIANPKGGNVPVDPESLKPFVLDKISKRYWHNPEFRSTLRDVQSLNDVLGCEFDCVYLAGGHGTMFDFPDNDILQAIVKTHYERKKIVAAICHGVCGLLDVILSDGKFLVSGKKLTGFSWFEETLAARKRVVPFNLQTSLLERGAEYTKAFIPMTSKVIIDGNLITGQNPFSSKEMAKVVMRQLSSEL